MSRDRVVVVGAGIAGLVAALLLAVQGRDVVVLERQAAPGGKLRPVDVGTARIDGGPTVFTMRWVFDAIFGDAGARLEDHLTLQPATVLARHAWSAGEWLDLFADPARTADAIGAFAGAAEARGYREFCARAQRIYRTLERPFILSGQPTPLSLVGGAGWTGLSDLLQIGPFDTLWRALGRYFQDPRLRQLFGRYATYCGSSPFLAPATLMLIAHVEQDGVWLVQGGMHRIAQALADLAQRHGAAFRYGTDVTEIRVAQGRAAGVTLRDGEQIDAGAVVLNADVAALTQGCFGAEAARAVPPVARAQRSLSAITWAMTARVSGAPLTRHTVFFSRDYQAEFDALFRRAELPAEPTVYVCAQDRGASGDDAPPSGAERLLCLVNAPPSGDAGRPDPKRIAQCATTTFSLMERCGLTLHRDSEVLTTPAEWNQLFPGTGGALYGQATHGTMASFRRPTARSTLPGLILAGGSVHPGAGLPMAALSGRMAAAALLTGSGSISLSRRAATPGGTSMR